VIWLQCSEPVFSLPHLNPELWLLLSLLEDLRSQPESTAHGFLTKRSAEDYSLVHQVIISRRGFVLTALVSRRRVRHPHQAKATVG
jgi:hypothetical protein